VLALDRAEHFSIGEWGQCLLKHRSCAAMAPIRDSVPDFLFEAQKRSRLQGTIRLPAFRPQIIHNIEETPNAHTPT
jgi:hypothetical protein